MSRLHTPLRATASLVRVSAPKSFQGAREKGDFMRKRQLAILALVAACLTTLAVIAGSATAGPFTVAPPAVISAPSPFTNCNIGLPDGGTNYLNAEVEPWVAVNPANPSNIIGVYQQDRWSNGGARGLVASVTHDGGATWTRSWAPFSFCSGGNAANGGDFERASDPWVTFAPNGDAYQIAINFNGGFNFDNAVTVSKSTDGGDTWSPLTTLIREADPLSFNDKESITADPFNANYVYAVWDRSRFPSDQASFNALHGFSFRGDIWFSRTTNGGASWEPARPIFVPRANQFSIGNQIVVLPNGDLVDITFLAHGSSNQRSAWDVAVLRSTNRGVTWSSPIIVSGVQAVSVRDPETGQLIRTGDILPEIAVDRASGALYAVWQDARFSIPPPGHAYAGIALSKSTDGGFTWTSPVQVNQRPDVQALTPSVEVGANGTVGVTYYDFRNNTSDPGTLPTDYFIVHSHDGGATFGDEAHVAGPFDMKTAPRAGGFFVGDYEGLATIGNTFIPVFVQANSGNTANRTDVFETTAGP